MTLKRYTYEVIVIVDSDEPVPSADVRTTMVDLLQGETVTTEAADDAVIDEVVVS
jgi:hypothetical protein